MDIIFFINTLVLASSMYLMGKHYYNKKKITFKEKKYKTNYQNIVNLSCSYYKKNLLTFTENTKYMTIGQKFGKGTIIEMINDENLNINFANYAIKKKILIALENIFEIGDTNFAFIDARMNVILDVSMKQNGTFDHLFEDFYHTVNIDNINLYLDEKKNYFEIFTYAIKNNHPVIKTLNKDVCNMIGEYL